MLDALRSFWVPALRSIRRAPTFTITAVLILAVAIGTSAAMFTVFDSVLIRPLPVQDQDRIVEVSGVAKGAGRDFPGGAAVGLTAALVSSKSMRSMLFEVSPSDPVTVIGMSLLLLMVCVAAAYLPARRATKIDPSTALRAE